MLPLMAALSGCASISAIPLGADGLTAIPGAVEGIRYYPPRPYLLVMALPVDPTSSTGTSGTTMPTVVNPPQRPPGVGPLQPLPAPGPAAAPAPGPGPAPVPAPRPEYPPPGAAAPATPNNTNGSPSAQNGSQGQQASSTPGSASDTSFSATATTYVAKIVYFPDFAHPMALKMTTGPFGTASMQVTLQDGWMLTNISMNADSSQNATLLTSAMQALAGGLTGGASTAAGAVAKAAPAPGSAPTRGGVPPNTATGILAPGLYAFNYTAGYSRVSSVCAIAYFSSAGSRFPTAPGMLGACPADEPRMPSYINGIPAQ
jgi:hypothetical protein